MNPVVLIVDDNEDNRCVLADVLEDEGYELREAGGGIEALQSALDDPPDIILLDVNMPDMNGLECCRRLAADERTSHVPIILVTALHAEEHVVQGLNAGAVDFISKPFGRDVARARIRAALRTKLMQDEVQERNREVRQLASELKARNEELTALALYDGLTGLANRVLFTDRLTQAIAEHRRNPDRKFAVLFVDIDRFKYVNDSLGHEAGDQLLQAIGQRLRAECRDADTVSSPGSEGFPSRIGGDEFVILLEGLSDVRDAEWVAQRLQARLAAPFNLAGHPFVASASIGIATSDLGCDSADQMLRDADSAMYHAKQAGKACYVVFDRAMQADLARKVAQEERLREALDQRNLIVHYQPVVSLNDHALVGFEAVARMPTPDGKLIEADDFIPLADEIGAIVALGHQLVPEAIRQLGRWRAAVPETQQLRLMINLWQKQVRDPELLLMLEAVLEEAKLEPSALTLEIPESVFLDTNPRILGAVEHLRSLGIRLAMDGCGQGQSALTHLHRIPIDELKIDRAVTTNLGSKMEYAAILQAVITLAHNLGMQVVAVGVENADQLAQLQALECDYGQGHFLGAPAAADQCASLISDDQTRLRTAG